MKKYMKFRCLSLNFSVGFRRLFALLLCCYLPLLPALADDWHFSPVDRIVAVGDIHGAYDAVVTTFQQAGVIDDSLAWNGGETHLVLTGDLLGWITETAQAVLASSLASSDHVPVLSRVNT